MLGFYDDRAKYIERPSIFKTGSWAHYTRAAVCQYSLPPTMPHQPAPNFCGDVLMIQFHWPLALLLKQVPGSIPGTSKGFYVWFFVFLLLCFYFICPKIHYLVQHFAVSFCNFNLFSILNIMQDLWPIIRVQRYRPSIFKLSKNPYSC